MPKYFVITALNYTLQIEFGKFLKAGIYSHSSYKWFELLDSRGWLKHKRC